MNDQDVNSVVEAAAGFIVKACNENLEDITVACFGLAARCAVSLGIPNDAAHEMLASLLAQRMDGGKGGAE